LREGLELALFDRNLMNKEYFNGGVDIQALGVATAAPGAPRTFGFEVRYAF
jgi:TonB dependent receptor.